MGRTKKENTVVIPVRLPKSTAEVLKDAAHDHQRSRNDQMWSILENWLITEGYLIEADRKRKPPVKEV